MFHQIVNRNGWCYRVPWHGDSLNGMLHRPTSSLVQQSPLWLPLKACARNGDVIRKAQGCYFRLDWYYREGGETGYCLGHIHEFATTRSTEVQWWMTSLSTDFKCEWFALVWNDWPNDDVRGPIFNPGDSKMQRCLAKRSDFWPQGVILWRLRDRFCVKLKDSRLEIRKWRCRRAKAFGFGLESISCRSDFA